MFVGYKKADHFSIQPSDQGPQEGLKGCQGVFKFSEKKKTILISIYCENHFKIILFR